MEVSDYNSCIIVDTLLEPSKQKVICELLFTQIGVDLISGPNLPVHNEDNTAKIKVTLM